MTTIYLTRDQVPAVIRGGYNGRFSAVVCESMTIPATAGMWDGGSVEHYRVLRLSDGASVGLSDGNAAFHGKQPDRRVDLTNGVVVVRTGTFCGKDGGMCIYMHPDNAAPLLAPADDLSKVEQMVLDYTAGRKSSYAGKDRYAMARDDAAGYSAGFKVPADFPSRAAWDEAKAALIGKSLLNKAGAITPAGRNRAGRV